jgi:hypothetical protein
LSPKAKAAASIGTPHMLTAGIAAAVERVVDPAERLSGP